MKIAILGGGREGLHVQLNLKGLAFRQSYSKGIRVLDGYGLL